jgi:hypothetical protein
MTRSKKIKKVVKIYIVVAVFAGVAGYLLYLYEDKLPVIHIPNNHSLAFLRDFPLFVNDSDNNSKGNDSQTIVNMQSWESPKQIGEKVEVGGLVWVVAEVDEENILSGREGDQTDGDEGNQKQIFVKINVYNKDPAGEVKYAAKINLFDDKKNKYKNQAGSLASLKAGGTATFVGEFITPADVSGFKLGIGCDPSATTTGVNSREDSDENTGANKKIDENTQEPNKEDKTKVSSKAAHEEELQTNDESEKNGEMFYTGDENVSTTSCTYIALDL